MPKEKKSNKKDSKDSNNSKTQKTIKWLDKGFYEKELTKLHQSIKLLLKYLNEYRQA